MPHFTGSTSASCRRKIQVVRKGDKLILLGESGEWFNVRLENRQEGWINSRFVQE